MEKIKIKAEVKDGKLILNDNEELNIEALFEIADYTPETFKAAIDDIIVSTARTSLELLHRMPDHDLLQMRGHFPNSESIQMLGCLSEILSKM